MTRSTKAPLRAELSPEDNVRMRRLAEEVQGRLHEMALITSRNLDIPLTPEVRVKFDPHEAAADADQTIEVVVIALPDGTFGCYQDPPGVCVYPC